MKKVIALLCSLLVLIFASSCSNEDNPPLEEGTIEHGGLHYMLSEDESSYYVSGVAEEREEYTVAQELEGKPVTAIGSAAFYNADYMKNINLPDSLTKLESYAFDNCYSLASVDLPASVEFIGFNAFSDCTALSEIHLPDSLKTLSKGAFERCESLEKVYINSALKVIEEDAFDDCDNIKELHIADIAAWCSIKIDSLESNPVSIADKVYVNGEIITELVIEGIEKINDGVFYKFSSLEKVTLGEGVKNVGISAFSNCENLMSLIISDSVERFETSAFNSCKNLQYVSVGTGMQYFAGLSFYGCRDIRVLEIKDIVSWCKIHFYTDNSGTSNPLRYADELRINGVAVTELVIPEGVTSISSLAFISFYGESVVIPTSVRSIANNAFYETKITTIRYKGKLSEWNKMAIGTGNFNLNTTVELLGEM